MKALEVEQIAPSQLHFFWPFLEHGLKTAKRKSPADWDPEEHYAYIYSGRAECFVVHRERRWIGFFDGYPMPIGAPHTERKYFLWVCYSIPPRDRDDYDKQFVKEDLAASLEFVKHRMRFHGCKYVETNSSRLIHRMGFTEHCRTYRLFS